MSFVFFLLRRGISYECLLPGGVLDVYMSLEFFVRIPDGSDRVSVVDWCFSGRSREISFLGRPGRIAYVMEVYVFLDNPPLRVFPFLYVFAQ